jgi:hypothetical protein
MSAPGLDGILRGEAAKALIKRQIDEHSHGIMSVLARYEVSSAVHSLHESIRAVEEFINIPRFSIREDRDRQRLLSVSLGEIFLYDPGPTFELASQILQNYVEPGAVKRYCRTLMLTAAIGMGFRQCQGQPFEAGVMLSNVSSATAYYQIRRRHLVTLLYTMPAACTGSERLAVMDALNVLLPQIDVSGATVTSLHQNLALMDVFDDFELSVDETGFSANHTYHALETDALEPERASIMAMYELRPEQIDTPELEPVAPDLVFSGAELRNGLKLLSAAYAAFDLDDQHFSTLAQLIKFFVRHCRDNYFIEIPVEKFYSALQMQTVFEPNELEVLLLNTPSDYATNSNAYEPFIRVGDTVISNVNLLSRFMYAFKNIDLGSRKRFQIHTGFIFEDMVKRDLEALGFTLTGIKRINRKEFDVVTTRNGVIHNFQCKNNAIDLTLIESDRELFVRYNRSLVNYYRKALSKEEGREALLKTELGLDQVEHYVVSRFPVMDRDPRIINYNQLLQRLSSMKVAS